MQEYETKGSGEQATGGNPRVSHWLRSVLEDPDHEWPVADWIRVGIQLDHASVCFSLFNGLNKFSLVVRVYGGTIGQKLT